MWDYLLYGTPPPGLNVRLSIDLGLQKQSDDLLGDLKGAAVLLNAQTGEVLSMASHPTYDPNKLDQIGALLPKDEHAPLLNRAAQGMYPLGTAGPAFSAATGHQEQPAEADLVALYQKLGFYSTPELRMPVASAGTNSDIQTLRVSPLQMAIAASALSNKGVRPVPRIALAVETPQQGWVILPALGQTRQSPLARPCLPSRLPITQSITGRTGSGQVWLDPVRRSIHGSWQVHCRTGRQRHWGWWC